MNTAAAIAKWCWERVWPPSDVALVPEWQKRIAIGVLIVGAVNALIIALAVGAVPILYSGVAAAGDVRGVQEELIDARITRNGELYCQALSEGNHMAATFARENLRTARARYKEITGDDYALPSCAELIPQRAGQ